MNALGLILFGLLSTQGSDAWKSKRGNRHATREVGHDHANDEFSALGTGLGTGLGAGLGTGLGASGDDGGITMGGGGPPYLPPENRPSTAPADGHYHGPEPVTTDEDPVGFDAIRNFAHSANAAIETYGPGNIPKISGATGAVSVGGVRVQAPAVGPTGAVTGPANGLQPPSGAPYDFTSAMNNIGSAPGANGEQLIGTQGEVVDGRAPSVFNYQPHFGGKDINNFPHILPPGGKSIQELQNEADAQFRGIVAKAQERQHQTLQRIDRLKSQYGVGTIGYRGYTLDQRFNIEGKIDLGTYKGIDLGTSIDAQQLLTADGKLKLPIQNVYHTKTVGIKIPQPYPVREEVRIPEPYPVPHYIPVPTPTPQVQVHTPEPQTISITAQANGNTGYTTIDTGYGLPRQNTNVVTIGQNLNTNNVIQGLQVPPLPSRHDSSNTRYTAPFTGEINYLDDSDSSEERQTANTARNNNFSIEPSRTVSQVSSVGALPLGQNDPLGMITNSYGPPAAGPIKGLKSFIGSAGASAPIFPPFTMSFAQLMHQASRPSAEYLPVSG